MDHKSHRILLNVKKQDHQLLLDKVLHYSKLEINQYKDSPQYTLVL